MNSFPNDKGTTVWVGNRGEIRREEESYEVDGEVSERASERAKRKKKRKKMLLLRLIVVSSLCWVARCDLLDLYVQHMDEAMKTLAYRSRHHRPKDVRMKRSVREEQPLLRIGTFKKQRLDVDKDWYAQWKAKRKILPYKEDGLDFPNSREENLDPNQHELVDDNNPARVPGRESEETTSRRYAIDNETTGDELDIEVSKEESTRSNHDTAFPDERMSIDNNEDRSRGMESREETTRTMDFRRDIEIVGNSQYEIIGHEPPNTHLLDDPTLKSIPKSRDRVPKKYIPPMDKLAKLFRGHAKYVANWEEGSVEGKNRGRRSVKEPRFTRRETLDDDGEVVLEWDPSDEEMVTFKVTAKTLGYVGIGFNEKNHMKGADILLAWVDDHTGTVNLLVSSLFRPGSSPLDRFDFSPDFLRRGPRFIASIPNSSPRIRSFLD